MKRRKLVTDVVALVVPGETVFFRAAPPGLVYRGAPDSLA